MASKRRRRTSIRTASGAAQVRFLERIRALRDDPLRVLPEPIGDEPKPLRKARARLERIAKGKVSILDRRDKGIVGAVVQILDVAEWQTVPRLMDQRVDGQRRFFLQRGHVSRGCSLGVQNHDAPVVLLQAYREMAKRHGLHFFAGDRVWCSGSSPQPPRAWLDSLAAGVALQDEAADRYGCGHDGARVALGLRGGPDIVVCPACAKTIAGDKAKNVHARLAERYAGPRIRHPVDVGVVLPDATRAEPSAEDLAAYRAGVADEQRLTTAAVAAWRDRASDERRYVLGERDLGSDVEAFLDAIGSEAWERPALRELVSDGHVGERATVDAVMRAHRQRWPQALAALAGEATADEVLARHRGVAPRQLLREARRAAERVERTRDLPPLALGPVGGWIDAFVRNVRAGERREALATVAPAIVRGVPPPFHLYAFLQAAGGDQALETRFASDDREAAEGWGEDARALLAASGDAYRERLAAYLRETGTGEKVRDAGR